MLNHKTRVLLSCSDRRKKPVRSLTLCLAKPNPQEIEVVLGDRGVGDTMHYAADVDWTT